MLEKIKKLLALAQDPAASQGERDNAARMAAKLMAKHEISQADLDLVSLATELDLTELQAQACRPGKKNPKQCPAWINLIAVGVMRFTRTRLHLSGPVLSFRGPRQDCELAKWLHEYILEQCYKQSTGRSTSEATAFRLGFAGAIQKRLKEMAIFRQEEEQALTPTESTALVVSQVKREILMDRRWGPDNSRIRPRHHTVSQEGRDAGMRAHIPTNRPLSTSSTTARLK